MRDWKNLPWYVPAFVATIGFSAAIGSVQQIMTEMEPKPVHAQIVQDTSDRAVQPAAIEPGAAPTTGGVTTASLTTSITQPARTPEAQATRNKLAAISTVPLIVDALTAEGLTDPKVVAYALATVEHETAGTFQPIEEWHGRQQAVKLGYDGGADYFGRGFIQLTHLKNYREMGARVGVPDLAAHPEKALEPEVAAKILAAFFKDRGVAKIAATGDFVAARWPINRTDKAQQIAQLANKYLAALT